MTRLQLFIIVLPFVFAYFHVIARVVNKWCQEDRVLRQSLAGVVMVDGRLLIRDEKNANVMYYDDFYTLPYRPGAERGIV